MGLIGILFFALIQFFLFCGLIFLWLKINKKKEDDTRWSRSFQYIQEKISVFEDLSDRTEKQVKQLSILMENKICDLQRKIDEADGVLLKISTSMKKSMEVAQIFQDKIPHEEIIERQNTVKFVKAAILANEGQSIDEILEVIDLPRSQVEFIVKVNSDRLSFDASQIPEWLKLELNKDPMTKQSFMEKKRISSLAPKSQFRSPLRPLNEVFQDRFIVNEQTHFIETTIHQKEDLQTQSSELASNTMSGSKESSLETKFRDSGAQNSFLKETIIGNSQEKTEKIKQQEESARIQVKNQNQRANNLASSALGEKAKEMGIRPVVFPRI